MDEFARWVGVMTKEQEAQQAQTVKKTRELLQIARFNNIQAVSVEVADELLEIVDSQAQKIADQATVIEEMHAHTVTLNALYLQAEDKIAEQAKEIERKCG